MLPTFEHEGPAMTQLANGHFPMALFEDGSYGSPESNERELLDGSPALGIAGDAYGSGALCTLDPHGVVRCRGNIEHYDLWVAPGTEPDALTLTQVNLGAKRSS
ncbi:MAG TPA: hypothetical protein VHO25_04330 [Polyangiaceae bacterium]|nr:hypothetical protein [Polyangiaceae bacterium]